MKKANKNLLLLYTILLFMVAGIIFVIVFVNTPPSKDPQADVIISYHRPTSFDPVKSTQFNATPVETASPKPTATVTPLSMVSVAGPENAVQWILTIRDPLGDLFPLGQSPSAVKVCLLPTAALLFRRQHRELTICVSAEGYVPGEFTVTPNSSPLVLDYLCDFSIYVEDEKGVAAPNTTIRIWKSNPPPRPIKDQATIYTSNGNSFRLKRNEGECRVIWVSKPHHWYEATGSSDGDVYPQMGDLVMALGACAWQAGYAPLYINRERIPPAGEIFPLTLQRSRRLRIWDTFCLAERTDSNKRNTMSFPQVLEILRENQLKYYYQRFPNYPEDQPPIYEEKTNDNGEWKLRGVPPALYYVQAIGEKNLYSEVMTLYPACGGARLRLLGKGGLWVYVEREGITAKDKLFARVSGAEVILQSSQTGIKVYAKKSDYEEKPTRESALRRVPAHSQSAGTNRGEKCNY